jgi:hypothetical protein
MNVTSIPHSDKQNIIDKRPRKLMDLGVGLNLDAFESCPHIVINKTS